MILDVPLNKIMYKKFLKKRKKEKKNNYKEVRHTEYTNMNSLYTNMYSEPLGIFLQFSLITKAPF